MVNRENDGRWPGEVCDRRKENNDAVNGEQDTDEKPHRQHVTVSTHLSFPSFVNYITLDYQNIHCSTANRTATPQAQNTGRW